MMEDLVQRATADASPSRSHPVIEYVALPMDEFWWCNSHNRRATHLCKNSWNGESVRCAPGLGGIMLPCSCVNLTHECVLCEC